MPEALAHAGSLGGFADRAQVGGVQTTGAQHFAGGGR